MVKQAKREREAGRPRRSTLRLQLNSSWREGEEVECESLLLEGGEHSSNVELTFAFREVSDELPGVTIVIDYHEFR